MCEAVHSIKKLWRALVTQCHSVFLVKAALAYIAAGPCGSVVYINFNNYIHKAINAPTPFKGAQ